MVNGILPLVETFGPTIQGEGPAAGRQAVFVRLGGCNLSCSWCDTPYSWDGHRFNLLEQITMTPYMDIVGKLPPAQVVVITGGEPLMYQNREAWTPFLFALADRYLETHLETNGTIQPNLTTVMKTDHISVSPKLGNAGEHRGRQDPAIWAGWEGVPHSVFKFVVENEQDVLQAKAMATRARMPMARTWVMPLGTTPTELEKRWPDIAQAAARHGMNATHRLHVLAWGDERGH